MPLRRFKKKFAYFPGMKKTLLLSVLLLGCISLKAQQSVLLKMEYKPGKKYLSTNQSKNDITMDLKADEAIMAKIREAGQKFPMNMESIVDMEMLMETGSRVNNNLPFILVYNKFNTNNNVDGKDMPMDKNLLQGKKIYGKIEGGLHMKIDSIPGDMAEDIKSALISSISQLTQQFKFPDKPVKIGESFVQELPVNMPIAGNNLQIIIKSTYKFVSVTNNDAIFDIVQDATADLDFQQATMKMKGNGTGQMVYSIADNFVKSSTSDFEYTYNMQMEGMDMMGTSKSKSQYKVAVSDK